MSMTLSSITFGGRVDFKVIYHGEPCYSVRRSTVTRAPVITKMASVMPPSQPAIPRDASAYTINITRDGQPVIRILTKEDAAPFKAKDANKDALTKAEAGKPADARYTVTIPTLFNKHGRPLTCRAEEIKAGVRFDVTTWTVTKDADATS
jgi:hypothetical protein